MARPKRFTPVAVATTVCLALTACGSGGASDDGSSGGATADVVAALKILEPFTGKASAFPVDEPLTAKPEGATFGFLQCVTPICGLMGELMGPATDTLGVDLQVVKADPSATGMQSALESIIATDPAAVLFPAVEPSAITAQLGELDDASIPTVANGIMDHETFGIDAAMFNSATAKLVGQLQAAWVVKNHEGDSSPVFYSIPELSFTKVEEQAFVDTMAELCPDCEVRTKDISVTSIGTKAPAEIVSDLQANPDSNTAVFSSMEMATGLPAALKVASIDIDTVGFGPNPGNLQDIKTGALTAGIGLDVPVTIWSQVDAAARLVTGQDLTAGEKAGIPPMQVLEQADITFDPSHGWTGYPDFAERFAKLWSGQS